MSSVEHIGHPFPLHQGSRRSAHHGYSRFVPVLTAVNYATQRWNGWKIICLTPDPAIQLMLPRIPVEPANWMRKYATKWKNCPSKTSWLKKMQQQQQQQQHHHHHHHHHHHQLLPTLLIVYAILSKAQTLHQVWQPPFNKLFCLGDPPSTFSVSSGATDFPSQLQLVI